MEPTQEHMRHAHALALNILDEYESDEGIILDVQWLAGHLARVIAQAEARGREALAKENQQQDEPNATCCHRRDDGADA